MAKKVSDIQLSRFTEMRKLSLLQFMNEHESGKPRVPQPVKEVAATTATVSAAVKHLLKKSSERKISAPSRPSSKLKMRDHARKVMRARKLGNVTAVTQPNLHWKQDLTQKHLERLQKIQEQEEAAEQEKADQIRQTEATEQKSTMKKKESDSKEIPFGELIKCACNHTSSPYIVRSESQYTGYLKTCLRRIVVQQALEDHMLSQVKAEKSSVRIRRAWIIYDNMNKQQGRDRADQETTLPLVNAMVNEISKIQTSGKANSRMKGIFRQLDEDEDGKVSIEEVLQYSKKLGVGTNATDMDLVLQMLDRDGDCTIDEEELQEFAKRNKALFNAIRSRNAALKK